ncbi:Uma2 family endonuclease [Candidatus Viridilinea mediisalina]|uniref:Putative restriction endonuclease domain-containing protein n=1 Tax=Candidatus Viridilinea mediisalina TaxID=2024553 RepID=A0A2A6RNK9_9CHLR|nr:Uma2 family endonuclease [Candidatus Viridilinea mediisalina]PDW04468.1 hypothetical protein CJ255_03565 [Candidatus Viridilinea mediisalina]
MTTTTEPLTAEAFAALPESSLRQELVFGEVVETMPPGGIHGAIAALCAAFLIQWNRKAARGVVGVESGFRLSQNPDTVRSPDCSYVQASRVPAEGVPEGFWPIPPDLAVEVVSPSDNAEELQQKVQEYLAAGSALVWVVYPRTRQVIAHTPDGLARSFGAEDTLSHAQVLPGFSLVVKELFS